MIPSFVLLFTLLCFFLFQPSSRSSSSGGGERHLCVLDRCADPFVQASILTFQEDFPKLLVVARNSTQQEMQDR